MSQFGQKGYKQKLKKSMQYYHAFFMCCVHCWQLPNAFLSWENEICISFMASLHLRSVSSLSLSYTSCHTYQLIDYSPFDFDFTFIRACPSKSLKLVHLLVKGQEEQSLCIFNVQNMSIEGLATLASYVKILGHVN